MTQKQTRVLMVEDNPGDALLLQEMLGESGSNRFEWIQAGSLAAAIDTVEKDQGIDVVLLDLGLPDSKGLTTLRKMRSAEPRLPVVVLTGWDDEDIALQSVQDGAQDYLPKNQLESQSLLRSIRYSIERQRMLAENERVRREQLVLKDEFLSHVSHELRSPLTAIYQFVTILLDGLAGQLNAEQRQYLQIVFKNSKQLQAMIEDLLEVTRAETGKLTVEQECVCLKDSIQDVVHSFQGLATTRNIQLAAEVPEGLPVAYADPARVRQILTNLIDNAFKFTPADRSIHVRARVFQENRSFLLVEVSDAGCGIAADACEKIFERLYQVPGGSQSPRKGLGLGLYICRELVTRHGGKIWVTSQAGKGSTFSFLLPVFSLPDLIAPVLSNRDHPVQSIALVTVEISPMSHEGAKPSTALCRAIRNRLQQCALPDLDVVLPKMRSWESGKLFFVVAAANTHGADVLTKRIQEQLALLDEIPQEGFDCSVFHQLIDSSSIDKESSKDEFVHKVTTEIERLIHSAGLNKENNA